MFAIFGVVASLVAKVASHVIGAHLFGNLGGAGLGTVWSLVEGLGFRFFLGMGTAFYFENSGFRSAINQAFKALAGTIGL